MSSDNEDCAQIPVLIHPWTFLIASHTDRLPLSFLKICLLPGRLSISIALVMRVLGTDSHCVTTRSFYSFFTSRIPSAQSAGHGSIGVSRLLIFDSACKTGHRAEVIAKYFWWFWSHCDVLFMVLKSLRRLFFMVLKSLWRLFYGFEVFATSFFMILKLLRRLFLWFWSHCDVYFLWFWSHCDVFFMVFKSLRRLFYGFEVIAVSFWLLYQCIFVVLNLLTSFRSCRHHSKLRTNFY